MKDNLVQTINSIRNNLLGLRGKSSKIKTSLESLDTEVDAMASALKRKINHVSSNLEGLYGEIDKTDTRFDKMLSDVEVYKAKLEREMGREVRRLEKEIERLSKGVSHTPVDVPTTDQETLRVATTVSIFECVIRSMCGSADDFRLASYAFLFPAVFERVVGGGEEAYLLDEMPPSATLVVQRGREYLDWIRSGCSTHLTDPKAWEEFSTLVFDWWRNDALPLLYGARDEQWDTDEPMSLVEMLSWQDDVAGRPLNFSPVWDAYEIYSKHKDEVYEPSGVRAFEVKMFSFQSNQNGI
jgi:archaellum component FlaC